MAVLLFVLDTSQTLPSNQEGSRILYRNDYGEGDTQEELIAQVEGSKDKEALTVTIGELEYGADEVEEILTGAGKKLDTIILGENESLDQVRSSLNLVTKVPETSIEVAWEISDYNIMDAAGEIHRENLDAGGTMLTLTAVLSYNQTHVVQEIPVCVYPPLLSDREAVKQSIEHAVSQSEEASKSEKEVVLPDEAGGNKIIWSRPKQQRSLVILVLGGVMAGLTVLAQQEKRKQKEKKKNRQMLLDYPEIVNQYTVLLSAGLTAKNAWLRMVEEYEKKKSEENVRFAYEEMVYTAHEMQSGQAEAECYERFGQRCGLQEYLKFGAMLSQNLKKGSKGLADILKQEAKNAFEERKLRAKKLGEEAGTKLLLPMVLMLLVVFIIIIVPAFLSIQL